VPLGEVAATVTVDSAIRHQSLIGFGASLAYVENQVVNHPRAPALYEAMFAELGLDVLRLRNRYGYVNNDLATAGTIVEAAAASLGTAPTVLLVSWSPPAVLKASGATECQGNADTCTLARATDGTFDYAGLATHWRESLVAYADVGVVPEYIGIQNNPDFVPEVAAPGEACRFLPTEGSATVRVNGVNTEVEYPGLAQALNAVAAELEGLSSPPSIAAPETSGVTNVAAYVEQLDIDQVGLLAHHLYDVNAASVNLDALTNLGALSQSLDRPLLQTEVQADGPGAAVFLHHTLAVEGAAGYLQGVLVGPAALVPVGPGMLIALGVDDFTLEEAYHALRHYARFTDPGWVRLEANTDETGLLASAFSSPGGEAWTVVLVNTTTDDLNVQLDLGELEAAGAQVVRTVFEGVERSAELGALSADGILQLPGGAVVTVAY
jgi:glucuronoarabinoxylan endo-1,4-beta-xylanase